MSKSYVTRQKARAKVQALEAFQTSNGQMFARWASPTVYAVFSYGSHWPLFVYDGTQWFENEDKCSVTTSHHRGYTHPLTDTQPRSTSWLRQFVEQAQ